MFLIIFIITVHKIYKEEMMKYNTINGLITLNQENILT